MSNDPAALIQSLAERGLLTDETPRNVKQWLSDSCYSAYHERILELLGGDDDAVRKLNEMFWTTIPFGTGGRRGVMGEMGPATINARTIAESAYGLARYMQQQSGTTGGTAVIAHDTRHNSQKFARITATTMAALGLKVYEFGPHARTVDAVGADQAGAFTHRSTPLLSFAVRHLQCDIGAMISASHNPPSDNGFKAYWNTGAQVVAPHDTGIIDCVNAAREIPVLDYEQAVADGQIVVLDDSVDSAFAEAILRLSLSPCRDIKAVFSPLHGVGETSAYDVAARAGFADVTIFEDHRLPDGGFPNVADQFPNPERVEVFESIIEAEAETDSDLILATDPDADRVALAVRSSDGSFVNLTGNQIGALLCDYVCRQRKAAGTLNAQSFVVETLVTTQLTACIARSYGCRAITDLLVGFKYIAEIMDEEGPENFVFATEESIGYLAGEYARDKDASIATLYLLELAAELRQEGRTLLDRLDELYAQHGVHAESQTSIYCKGSAGLQQIKELMQAFRSAPPGSLGGLPVEVIRDYSTLEERRADGELIRTLERPQGNLVFLDSAADSGAKLSIAARPSGTEPKIKFYLFAQEDPGMDLTTAKQSAAERLQQASRDVDAWVGQVLETKAS